uniref:DUF4774 domain-containing protein n=1 Tax=Panagrellus redivivus TaxID=6233 RepID=A0A7E4UTF4_PANRE
MPSTPESAAHSGGTMLAGTDDGTLESSLFVGLALFFTVGVSLLALCGKEGGARRPAPRKPGIASASKGQSRRTRENKEYEKRFHADLTSGKEKPKPKQDIQSTASGTGSSVPEDSGKTDDASQPEIAAQADKVLQQQSPPQETPLLTDNYESQREKDHADGVEAAAVNVLAEIKARSAVPLPGAPGAPPEGAAPAPGAPPPPPAVAAPALLVESEKAKEKEKEKKDKEKESEDSSDSSSPRKKKKKSKRKHKKDRKSSRKKKSKRKDQSTNAEKDKPKVVYPYVVTPPISPSRNRLRIRIGAQKQPGIFDQKKTSETVVTEGGARPGEEMIEVEKSVYMAVPHDYAMKKEEGIDPKTGLPYSPGTSYATGIALPIDPKTGKPYPPGSIYNTGVPAPIDPKTGLPYPPGTVYATGIAAPIDPKTGLPYPPGSIYNTGIPAPIDPKTGLPYPPGTVYATGLPGSPNPEGLQTCIDNPTVCKTGIGGAPVTKLRAVTGIPKGVTVRTGVFNDEPSMDKTQVKTRNTQTTQHGTFETGVENATLAGIPPIEETCIEDPAIEDQPTQDVTVVGSLASITAKRSTVETAVERNDPEKTQKIGISLLSTRTGMERSDHTQNPTISDIDRTQINTLQSMKTQMSTNTLATHGSPHTTVSSTQIPSFETQLTQIPETQVTGCTENTQAATHAGTEGTQAPTLQTGVTMVNTGVGKTVQTTQNDGTYVTQITQNEPTFIGRTNITQDPTHIAQTTQTGGVSGTQITWSTGVATTQSHLGTTQTGCASTFAANPTQKSTAVFSTQQTNEHGKAPVHYSLLGPPPGENGQAGSPPTVVENGALKKRPTDISVVGPAPSNANQLAEPHDKDKHGRKHRKKERTAVSQTQISELKPKKYPKSSKAEKIAELRLRKKATDYPTMNDVMSDWSSNDGIVTAAQMKEDDEKEIIRRKMEHEKDEQRRRNEEELVRVALAKQAEEKKEREREEARQASQKPTTQSRAAQTPMTDAKSRKEHRHKEKPPPAVSPAPKTAKAAVTPRNREEEEERVRKIRENKPIPRKFQRSSWEEKIATGKVTRKKHDYPTMNDVISDWDSTDSSGASDQQPESSKK